MRNLIIYVPGQESRYVPDNHLLCAIQSGVACNQRRKNEVSDDDSNPCSQDVACFGDLSALYWIYKHNQSNYCGFFQPRRYLSFTKICTELDPPVENLDNFSDENVSKLNINQGHILPLLNKYDILTAKRIYFGGSTVRQQFIDEQYTREKDLDLMIEILLEKYPEYSAAVDEYLNSKYGLAFQIFLTKDSIVKDYCGWLFDILFTFRKKMDLKYRNIFEYQAAYRLSEILWAIFLEHNSAKYSIGYLQTNYIIDIDPPYPMPAFRSEKNVVLAMSCSNEYVPYLSVTLQSVIEHSQKEICYDIVVLGDDITEQNKRIISRMIHSRKNFLIRFVDVSRYLSQYPLYTFSHYHPIIYARLLLPEIMRNYSKVLYLDADLVVVKDIFELYSYDIGDYLLAGVRDTGMIAWYNTPGHKERKYIDEYLHLKYPYEYINTGVLLFNITLFRNTFETKRLFEYAVSKKWEWQDQDVFMTLCEGKILLLQQEWNVLAQVINSENELLPKDAPFELYKAYMDARKDPKIVHFIANSFLNVEIFPDLGAYFWEYARKSPYYELILTRIVRHSLGQRQLNSGQSDLANNTLKKKVKNKVVMPVVDIFFPKGSMRRKRLKHTYFRLRGWE